jgi:hypothetical protein
MIRSSPTIPEDGRNMLSEMAISAVLVVASILIHYEALRLMSTFVPNLEVAVRVKVLIVVTHQGAQEKSSSQR